MSINLQSLRSPKIIFILYILVSSFLIMLFRFIFPGSAIPLPIFSIDWRFIQGALTLFDLFPALVFSALVIPFGLASYEPDYQSFSQMFFKRLATSVILAIISAVVYCGIFFLALPMIKNHESNIQFRGDMYHLSRENAIIKMRVGEWQEAMQHIDICYSVWPESPDLLDLREEIQVNLSRILTAEREEIDRARAEQARDYRTADYTVSGYRSLNATQAISLSQTAFNEGRFFEAHWLAVTGERLAVDGSVQAANAARLASEAWNQVASLAPSPSEVERYNLFETKVSGYQAMNAEDWIRAYYIFLELSSKTPDDPDVKNFLARSEQELQSYAFFADEIQLSLGEIVTGALFSIPGETGRGVMRFSNLKTSDDYAYGIAFEYMEFDLLSRPVISLRSDYAKLLPLTLNEKPQIMVITHALSRFDKDISWEAEWLIGYKQPAIVILDIDFDDFLLLAEVRQGIPNLQIDELFFASRRLVSTGYISEIFEAEILNRFGSAVFFLPMAILIIVMGWRYRAKSRPKYFFVLLLPVLPVVFHGFVILYRTVLNSLGIWLVLSLGFSLALTVYIIALALGVFVSLIILASQHS